MSSFTENDIRPADLIRAKRVFLEMDKRFLRNRRSLFVDVPCPACSATAFARWASKWGFTYVKCDSCATVYMQPRAPQEVMEEFYKQSKNYEFWNTHIFPASESTRKQKIFLPRARRVVEYCKKTFVPRTCIVDVGAAFGTFCECIRELGYFENIIAVEPTPALARTCREKGFTVMESPIEHVDIASGSIDVITAFEVIEHLFNPRDFILSCSSYLKRNGLLFLSCPNIASIAAHTLGKHMPGIDHEHVNYFNPSSIALLLHECNFKTEEVSTPGELDVELLRSGLSKHAALAKRNSALYAIISSADSDTQHLLQECIKRTNLSSHLWIVGRKE